MPGKTGEFERKLKITVLTAISQRTAQPLEFGDSGEMSVDFFPANDVSEKESQKHTRHPYIEGLEYLEIYVGRPLFKPNKSHLVVRKGHPYPIFNITTDKSHVSESDEEVVNMFSPQKKLSKLNLDDNQNNINETGGSPLKLQTYADLSTCDSPSSPAFFTKPALEVRPTPVGILARNSRSLLGLFNVSYNKFMIDSISHFSRMPSFWILCDRTNVKKHVLIGTEPVLSDLGGVTQWGVKSTMIVQHRTDDISSISADIFKDNVGENKCFARYDLVVPTDSTNEDSTAYHGSISLQFKWRNGSKLLQKPEFHSEAVIKASVSSGDVRSPAIVLFEELAMLRSFMTALSTNEINWAVAKDQSPFLDQVKDLIECLKLGDAEGLKKFIQDEDSEASPIMDQFGLKGRLDYDFTDYLWKIVITCSSYSDLTTGLNYIFKSLGKGEFQPAVHKKNQTMMAQFVRDSYTGRLNIPHLGGMFPLKLIVEMGVEKLRCDYVHAFVSQDLTTLCNLKYFLQTDVELDEKILRMEKMQYSLEMVVMIHLFLRLSYSVLGTCVRKMLNYFESNPINDSQVFDFPVQTNSVLPIIKDVQPAIWSLIFESKVGDLDFTECKVWTISTAQPFLHLRKVDEEADVKKKDEKPEYYLTHRDDHVSIVGY